MAQTPIELYYWPTPNGHKITIMCEEAGIPYAIKPVNIGKGDQFKPEFLAIAPNNRMPAIVDPDVGCAEEAAALGATWHASIEMLEHDIRHAIVAVPSARHAQVACALARRGVDPRHVRQLPGEVAGRRVADRRVAGERAAR